MLFSSGQIYKHTFSVIESIKSNLALQWLTTTLEQYWKNCYNGDREKREYVS
jgi:hypothetical protein